MNNRGFITVKEFPKGVENIVSVDMEHDALKRFRFDKVFYLFNFNSLKFNFENLPQYLYINSILFMCLMNDLKVSCWLDRFFFRFLGMFHK